MFKKNQRHLQPALISNITELPEKLRTRLETSWAGTFYRETFCRIREAPFGVLFSDLPSCPNTPVNVLVGLEWLKSGFGWSDEELYDAFCFDIQVRYALGYPQLGEGDFDLRTLYNFRRRVSLYYLEHGVNLLALAFEDITDQQISAFQVRTSMQRMDSVQIASNILAASRLQLAVEAVQRLFRMLSEAEQQRYAEPLAAYLSGHAGQYVYRVKGKAATQAHLQAVGAVLHRLLEELKPTYAQEPVYQVVARFFADNFRAVDREVQPKPNEELHASSLQSLDDVEATFRRKGDQEFKGYVGNLTETCDPQNDVQLITQVQAAPNLTDDAALMVDALPGLKERTDLEELYTDGGFGSIAGDEALRQQHVEQIQSAIRGKAPNPDKFNLSDFAIQHTQAGKPVDITCPQGQQVAVEAGRTTGYVARFDPLICQDCPFVGQRCRAQAGKRDPSYKLSFTQQEVHWARRRRRSREQQQSGQNLRAAVEASVRSLKHPFPAGKLPVRGLFRVTCLLIGSAVMINARRICRYLHEQAQRTRENASLTGENAGEGQEDLSFFVSFWARLARLGPSLWPVETCFSC